MKNSRDGLVRPTMLLLIALAMTACKSDGITPPCSESCSQPSIPLDSLLVWQDTATVIARPVFDDHAVYTLGFHNVEAFDKNTGARLWSTPLTYPAGAPSFYGYGMAVAAGRVIVGDIDVFGLDPATGAILWRFAPRLTYPGERAFQFLSTDGVTVYCGGVWGNVYALDAATGAEKWVAHVTTLPDSFVRVFSPTVDQGVVYSAFDDSPPGTVEINAGAAAIDAASGRLLWSQFLPHYVPGTSNETEGLTLTPTRVVIGAAEGFLYGLDRATGALRDTVPQAVFGYPTGTPNATIFELATADTVVFAGVWSGKIIGFDARNLNRILWQTDLTASPWDIEADSTRVYVDYGGEFLAFSRSTGKLAWSIGTQNGLTTSFLARPAFDGARLYVGSGQNIYALKWR